MVNNKIKKEPMPKQPNNKNNNSVKKIFHSTDPDFLLLESFITESTELDTHNLLKETYRSLIFHLISNKTILCNKGLFFVERYIFKRLKLSRNVSCEFVDRQVLLYCWLEPRHLDISNIPIDLKSDLIGEMSRTMIPMKKYNVLRQVVEGIVNGDRQKSLEDILPYLILFILNSKVSNIEVEYKILEKFVFPVELHQCTIIHNIRESDNIINEGCIHLKQNSRKSLDDDFKLFPYENVNFYITLLGSAIQFIRELAYDKLNIQEDEFNTRIEGQLKVLGDINQKRSKSGVGNHLNESFKYFKGLFKRD